VFGVLEIGDRHLVRAPGAIDRLAVDDLNCIGPVQPFGGAERRFIGQRGPLRLFALSCDRAVL